MVVSKKWEGPAKLLQSLYGLDLDAPGTMRPKFGSSIRFPLTTIAKEGKYAFYQPGDEEVRLEPPTMLTLAWHFGYMRWEEEDIANMTKRSNGKVTRRNFNPRWFLGAQRVSKEAFQNELVIPLRDALEDLEYPIYFFAVPAKTVTTDPITGTPETSEEDFVLCLLPKTVESAKHYGLSESEIELLAPQVGWLIRRFGSRHYIRSEKQLEEALDGWLDYFNPTYVDNLLDSVRESNPHLALQVSPIQRRLLE